MSIADFIADKLTAYLAGGMSAAAATWEALTERAAIMEFDGGLDRKTATLAAVALYFPGDYRAMRETAADYPYGETIMYEYLEGLIKSPQSVIEGARLNTERENVVLHGKAPDRPPMPRYEGIQALTYMTNRGIPLIGALATGKMIGKETPENFTTDPAEIASLMAGKGNRQGRGKGTAIERFYFIPADAGLLCLDIDRKPGKPDGLKELYNLFPRDTLPRALQDIDRFFPCHVTTPSGGYHLYFKYSGPLIRKTNLAPEVEVKHGRPGLTAPGSRKENGAYILHGEIENAPPLYGIILDRIAALQNQREAVRTAADRPAPRRAWASTGRQRITLDALADEATRAAGGNHDRQVSFAGRAARCKFPYTEALAYVKTNPAIFGTGVDTESTIKSVYQDKGAL